MKKPKIVNVVPTTITFNEKEQKESIAAWKEGYNIAIVNALDAIKAEKLDAVSSRQAINIAYNRAIQDVLFSVKKLKQ